MTNSNLQIHCNPANPVEYLASLGIFAIASRPDPIVEGRWTDSGFELAASLSEAELVGLIHPVLSEHARWEFDRPDKEAYRVKVGFGSFSFLLDWWYDFVNDNRSERVFEKSNWKLFAGNQSVFNKIRDLTEAVSKASSSFSSLDDFVSFLAPVTGRFGFDPLASKSALDAGFSPDSLGEAVPTRVAAELLSLFAIQVFFPPRCGRRARGWIETEEKKTGFAYCLWEQFLPLTLARIAAVRNRNDLLFSEKRNRNDYGNLSPARMV